MDKNLKVAKELIRIAKSLSNERCAAIREKYSEKMDQEILDHFKQTLIDLNEGNYEDFRAYTHDGSSYNGYMSFTEGFAEGTGFICGWEFDEYGLSDEFKTLEEESKNCFIYDNKELFSGDTDEENREELEAALDTREGELFDQYQEYEDSFIGETEISFFIAVQFKAYQDEDDYSSPVTWKALVVAGTGDEYGRRKTYNYEKEIEIDDINDQTQIQKIDAALKEASDHVFIK